MKSKTWVIYCHTHTESGRRYIGLTGKTILARWNHHVYAAKSSKGGRWYFPNAIRKYGKDAFSHRILEENIQTIEEANEAEKYWIKKYDTRNLEKGFNLAEGGEQRISKSPRKNPWDNPEYRAKITKASKDHWGSHAVSQQTRDRIGAKSKGRPKSPETIEKIRINGSRKTPESLQKMRDSLIRFYAEKPYIHRCEQRPDGKLYATCKKCSPNVPVEFRPDSHNGRHPRCLLCKRAKQNASYVRRTHVSIPP